MLVIGDMVAAAMLSRLVFMELRRVSSTYCPGWYVCQSKS
jgi:hypothetical protein